MIIASSEYKPIHNNNSTLNYRNIKNYKSYVIYIQKASFWVQPQLKYFRSYALTKDTFGRWLLLKLYNQVN